MTMKRKNIFPSVISVCLLLLILGAGISSCQKEYITLGQNFVDNNTTQLNLVDSSTVQLSTVYIDSFVTSGNGIVFAGHNNDPVFGKINAESYVRLGIPSTVTIPNGSVFDSIEVILKTNKKNYYGDTTIPYSISVHQLSTPITLPFQQTSFFNINSWGYNPVAWATKQIYYRPASTDTISIRLPDAVGQDLFNKLNSHAGELSTNDLFYNYFKGLALTGSSPANNLIIGFNDSVIMRLHYLQPGVISQDVAINFNITDQSYNFSHVTADRSGTQIASLNAANNQIYSQQSGNLAFSQFITGAMVKIRFPYLKNLQNLPSFVKIISAQLVVRPLVRSYSPIFPLPPSLELFATDQYNQPGAPLYNAAAAGAQAQPQTGNLVIDDLHGVGTQYTYDVTAYLLAQLAIEQNNQNGLLLLPPNPASIFNRVVVGNSINTSQTQLNVYYASVQQ